MDNLANNAESTVVHAYGIVPAGTPGPDVVGLGGAAVDVMPLGDVAVLVSRLSQAEYGTAVWEGHAEDPQWLGEVAAAHAAPVAVPAGAVKPKKRLNKRARPCFNDCR